MHNDIMVAGSKERPPMLSPGRYAQWQSPKPATATEQAVPEHNVPETYQMTTAKKCAYIDAKSEAIHMILSRIGDDIYSTYQNEVNEIRAERIARNANPLALIVVTHHYPNYYHQAPKPSHNQAPSSRQTSSSKSHATARNKGKEIVKPITPPSESASKEDTDEEHAQRDKQIQKKSHHMYMAKIQEVLSVTRDDTGPVFDSKPLEKNVDERVVLSNLITNLKLDTDESKKIQKQLRKANATPTHELNECKYAIEESNDVWKALYGLKQASRASYDEVSTLLISKGFTKEILKKYGMEKYDSIGTPMATKPKLDSDLSGTPVDQTRYQSMIWSLIYLTSSRPDLVQAVCYNARY
nr:uncharacterized mitochondrial protein AtMg00810-like [Tanacetum cinerariifolium]